MNTRNSTSQQLGDLRGGELYSHLKLPDMRFLFAEPIDKRLGQLRFAQRGDSLNLGQIGDG